MHCFFMYYDTVMFVSSHIFITNLTKFFHGDENVNILSYNSITLFTNISTFGSIFTTTQDFPFVSLHRYKTSVTHSSVLQVKQLSYRCNKASIVRNC